MSTGSRIPQITIDPSQLKRTTCDLCRERKVKCDRGKPGCLRCKRSGHRCTYPSVEGEATKLNSALQTLHARLAQAELRLQQRELTGDFSEFNFSRDGLSSIDVEHDVLADLSWDHSVYFDYPDSHLETDLGTQAESRHSAPASASSLQQPLPQQSLPQQPLSQQHLLPDLWATDPALSVQPSDSDEPPPSNKPDTQNVQQTQILQQTHSPKDASDSMEPFFDAYFDTVQRHLPLVNRDRFLSTTVKNDSHQSQALKYAVAMSGEASIRGEPSMTWYREARSHVERAEMEMGNSSFMNLETAQALLLISRFEFAHTNVKAQAAILTMARLTQLLVLLGYNQLDGSSTDRERTRFRLTPGPDANDPMLVHEKRCTFWAAFCMHCSWSGSLSHVLPSMPSEIHTLLPSPPGSQHSPVPLPSGPITQATTRGLDTFSLFVLSLSLVLQTHQHRRMTASNVAGTGALDYNFCLTHEKVETSVNAILSALMSAAPNTESGRQDPSRNDNENNEMRVLALLITLGARIELYKAAIVNAQKAEFLAPVVGECQRMGVMTANTMSDILLEAEALSESQTPLYKAMSLFIMPPLATAAEIQLCVLKKGTMEIGQNMFYTNREIRQSLETMCAAMDAFKEMTEQYNGLIRDAQSFLDCTHLGKRLNSEYAGRPSPQRRRTESGSR